MSGPILSPLRLVLALWILGIVNGSTGCARAQVAHAKVMRTNVRRDDVYRTEDVITVTAVGGAIHSPLFPNSYPRNLLLSWKLLSPPATRIQLEFDPHFGLEEAENGVCRYDFVEVEDQSQSTTIIWGRWCGGKAPPPVASKSTMLRITFKSDNYFVAKPGFRVFYSLLYDTPPSNTNWEAITVPAAAHPQDGGIRAGLPASDDTVGETHLPFSAEDLDRTIAGFQTVEQLLRNLNPETWKQDLDAIYTQTHIMYRSRAYQLSGRHNKVDLDRLYDDVQRYSCTPRNVSVNLREELRSTAAVFFPRCLLVRRCGGNCGCGAAHWHNCSCEPSRTISRLHEVLKYAPELAGYHRRKPRIRWTIAEVFLTHHDRCECVCPSRPPR